MRKPTKRTSATLIVSGLVLIGSACSGGNTGPANNAEPTTPKPVVSLPVETPKSSGKKPGKKKVVLKNADPTKFAPSVFADPLGPGNPLLPLKPGFQTIRKGLVNVGNRRLEHLRVYTITDVTKEIAGVRAVVILDQDFNGGQLAEQALDYLSEDKHGNVWYLGSYTETYEGGQFVNATDGWLAGVNGSEPGILMEAQPTEGMTYFQSNALGEGPTQARVIKTNSSKCVPYKCYKDVVVVEEDGSEYKYSAPGVGGILTEPHYSGGEQETELLINVRQLSPKGLDEISTEMLKVDRHAETVFPDVFGPSAPAKRTL